MTAKTAIPAELLDQLLANYRKPEDLTGEDGLFKQLKKALIERALGAELTDHLGYEKGDPAGRGSGNNRRVTDAVLDKVRDWQNRPLDPVYPVVFFDALRVKIRDEGLVKNKAVYIALALNADGEKEVLDLWIEQTEGARFWLKVMNDLKVRGVQDILIAVVDGLKGFPEAISTVFPQTLVQTCIVHLIRNSLAFVSWKDRNVNRRGASTLIGALTS
jgi:transposase-like protein